MHTSSTMYNCRPTQRKVHYRNRRKLKSILGKTKTTNQDFASFQFCLHCVLRISVTFEYSNNSLKIKSHYVNFDKILKSSTKFVLWYSERNLQRINVCMNFVNDQQNHWNNNTCWNHLSTTVLLNTFWLIPQITKLFLVLATFGSSTPSLVS